MQGGGAGREHRGMRKGCEDTQISMHMIWPTCTKDSSYRITLKCSTWRITSHCRQEVYG